jgi:hypothetical protein
MAERKNNATNSVGFSPLAKCVTDQLSDASAYCRIVEKIIQRRWRLSHPLV